MAKQLTQDIKVNIISQIRKGNLLEADYIDLLYNGWQKDFDIGLVLCGNPHTPFGLLMYYTRFGEPDHQLKICNMLRVPDKKYNYHHLSKKQKLELIEILAKHEDEMIRCEVAMMSLTPKSILDELAQSGDPLVIRGVLSNQNTNVLTKLRLLNKYPLELRINIFQYDEKHLVITIYDLEDIKSQVSDKEFDEILKVIDDFDCVELKT